MFEVGDTVTYKDLTGKVIFCCEKSLSILIGAELPKQTQTRVVVYNYMWDEVKLTSDSKWTVHYYPHRVRFRVL